MIMLIFAIAFMSLASGVFGFAVGFGEGYESRMLEKMSKKKRNEYLINKEIMKSSMKRNDLR